MPEHFHIKRHRIENVKIKEFLNIECLTVSDSYFKLVELDPYLQTFVFACPLHRPPLTVCAQPFTCDSTPSSGG